MITGAIAVAGRLPPAGPFAGQPPSAGRAKFVSASFRTNPPTVTHAPKLTLTVVVTASASPAASTAANALVDGAGARSVPAQAGRRTPGGAPGGTGSGRAAPSRIRPARRRGARISGTDALTPIPVRAHAMRTDSGRPSPSIRFRTWTPVATSVAWRRSARDRSASPITRL